MIPITDEMVEVVARAIYEADPLQDQHVDLDNRPMDRPFDIPWSALVECGDDKFYHRHAHAALTAAIPMIGDECARIAEGQEPGRHYTVSLDYRDGFSDAADQCASAIRSATNHNSGVNNRS